MFTPAAAQLATRGVPCGRGGLKESHMTMTTKGASMVPAFIGLTLGGIMLGDQSFPLPNTPTAFPHGTTYTTLIYYCHIYAV